MTDIAVPDRRPVRSGFGPGSGPITSGRVRWSVRHRARTDGASMAPSSGSNGPMNRIWRQGSAPARRPLPGLRAMRFGQAHDAGAGTEARFGPLGECRHSPAGYQMAATAQDHLDQRRRVGPDLRGPSLQSPRLNNGRGPFGMAAMTGRHGVGDRRVLAIARGSGMGGDALALVKNLDCPCGEPDPDLHARAGLCGVE